MERERIVGLRRRLGLSQTEFAERYGLKLKTLQAWEQGERKAEGAAAVLLLLIAGDPDGIAARIAKGGKPAEAPRKAVRTVPCPVSGTREPYSVFDREDLPVLAKAAGLPLTANEEHQKWAVRLLNDALDLVPVLPKAGRVAPRAEVRDWFGGLARDLDALADRLGLESDGRGLPAWWHDRVDLLDGVRALAPAVACLPGINILLEPLAPDMVRPDDAVHTDHAANRMPALPVFRSGGAAACAATLRAVAMLPILQRAALREEQRLASAVAKRGPKPVAGREAFLATWGEAFALLFQRAPSDDVPTQAWALMVEALAVERKVKSSEGAAWVSWLKRHLIPAGNHGAHEHRGREIARAVANAFGARKAAKRFSVLRIVDESPAETVR